MICSMKKAKWLTDIALLFAVLYLISGFHVGNTRGWFIIFVSGVAALMNFCFLCTIKSKGTPGFHPFIREVVRIILAEKWMLIVIFVAIALSGVSMLVHQEPLKQYLIMWCSFAIGMLSVLSIEKGEFSNTFVRLMLLVSLWSIAMYSLNLLVPTAMDVFPKSANHMGFTVYDTIFSVVEPKGNSTIHRNYGFFWEPGVYQTFLNLALIIVLFVQKTKKRIFLSMIFLIAIFTTFATGGILASFLIVAIYILRILFLSSDKLEGKRLERMNAVGLVLAIIAFGGVLTQLQPQYSHSVLKKLTDQLTGMEWESDVVVSVETSDAEGLLAKKEIVVNLPPNSFETGRVSAFWYPLKAFLQSPLFGLGYTSASELSQVYRYEHNTFTPILFFAENGLIFGLIMCLSYASIVLHVKSAWWVRVLLLIPLFAIISTEGYTQNGGLYMFVFWGVQAMPISKTKKRDF